MKFWEDFFSTDKIIYPTVGAFLGGLMICIGAFFMRLAITEVHILGFMAFGFIVGNLIKVNKLQEIAQLKPSKKKKSQQ